MRGINTKAQLARSRSRHAAAAARRRRSKPASRWLRPRRCSSAADTKFGRDVTVEPYVVFGPGVTVEDGAVIRSFSHLDGAHVGKGASVGPLRAAAARREARRGRRTSAISSRSRRRVIEAGAKANHLTYIGDAPRRRGRQHRRRHHHLQLRRRGQAPHRHRQGRLHRLELGAGRAGQDRRRRLCRLGLGDHRRRAGRTRWRSGAGRQAVKEGWAKRLRELKSLRQKEAR